MYMNISIYIANEKCNRQSHIYYSVDVVIHGLANLASASTRDILCTACIAVTTVYTHTHTNTHLRVH